MLGEIVEKPKPKSVKVSVVLQPSFYQFLKDKKAETNFSMSKIIQKALKEYFAGEMNG